MCVTLCDEHEGHEDDDGKDEDDVDGRDGDDNDGKDDGNNDEDVDGKDDGKCKCSCLSSEMQPGLGSPSCRLPPPQKL